MPSMPISLTCWASSTDIFVETLEMLPITGTRPATSSTVASMPLIRSESGRFANSPVVPDAQIPCTPLSIR